MKTENKVEELNHEIVLRKHLIVLLEGLEREFGKIKTFVNNENDTIYYLLDIHAFKKKMKNLPFEPSAYSAIFNFENDVEGFDIRISIVLENEEEFKYHDSGTFIDHA